MTRMTIAALPMVEAIEGISFKLSKLFGAGFIKELTHADNVPLDGVTKREITRYGDKNVD